jgi:hypothetical protein
MLGWCRKSGRSILAGKIIWGTAEDQPHAIRTGEGFGDDEDGS